MHTNDFIILHGYEHYLHFDGNYETGCLFMSNLVYQEEMRTEMLDNRIFAMSPRPSTNHNIVSGNIFVIFRNF